MGVAALDNVDKDWARDQLESEAPFLITSRGMFELGREDASNLLVAIEAGEDYPNFNWESATEAAAYGSAADHIAKYFMSAVGGSLPVDDMLKTAVNAGRENLLMSSEENLFYTDYVRVARDISLDCYLERNNGVVSGDFLTSLYDASSFAMSVVVGLRNASKIKAEKFIDKNRARLSLNADNIYNGYSRDKFYADLRSVASGLDGKRGLSDRELLAANAVYYTWLLDENLGDETVQYFLRDLGRRYTGLTPLERLALTALVGAYHYLQTPRQNEQVFYVTLDDFEFKSEASELAGIDPRKKTEIVKENIRKTIEDAYRDIKGVKIVYARPSSGTLFHTVFIPSDIVALSEIYRKQPPSKDNCYSVEKRLSEGNYYQKTSYEVLMQKYAVPGLTTLCETTDYSELMAEPLMIIWSYMGESQGHTNVNPGGRRQAQAAYVYGHITKLGAKTLTRVSDTAEFQFDMSMAAYWQKTLSQPSLSIEDRHAIVGDFIGSVAAHEMGHMLGLYDMPNRYQNGRPHLDDERVRKKIE